MALNSNGTLAMFPVLSGLQCLSLGSPRRDPETKIQVQIVYLGGNLRKHWQGSREVGLRREGNQLRGIVTTVGSSGLLRPLGEGMEHATVTSTLRGEGTGYLPTKCWQSLAESCSGSGSRHSFLAFLACCKKQVPEARENPQAELRSRQWQHGLDYMGTEKPRSMEEGH